jgi:hypothetical protein
MPDCEAKACCGAARAGGYAGGVLEALEIDATQSLVAYSDEPEHWNAIFQLTELRVALRKKRRIPLTDSASSISPKRGGAPDVGKDEPNHHRLRGPESRAMLVCAVALVATAFVTVAS